MNIRLVRYSDPTIVSLWFVYQSLLISVEGVYRTTAQQLQQQQMSKGEGGGHSQPDLIRQEVQV